MKVSIIIALYNTEKYIKKCLLSVINSSLLYSDYEIIVINDGSSDNSQKIVEKLILENPSVNINLINKINGGQSAARNLGIQIAKGDYLFFLDSDDYINGDLFKQSLEYAFQEKLDMLPITFVMIDEDYKILPFKDTYQEIEVVTGAEFLNQFVISGAMGRYFYKNEIIINFRLKLIENIFHEDEEFIIRFLSHVNRIAYQICPVYYYLQRANSTVNKNLSTHRFKLLNDLLIVLDSIEELIQENSSKPLLVSGIQKKKQILLIDISLRLLKEKFDKNQKKEYLNLLKTKGYLPLKVDKLDFKKKVFGTLINILYA